MPKYVYLSFPLSLTDPRPPAIPAPELAPLYTIAKDGAGVHTLKVASHTGTHVDAPCHVIEGGVPITAFAPEELIFTRPVVVELRAGDDEVVLPELFQPHAPALQHADLALLRFGYGAVRRTEPLRFSQHCPGLGVEAARWLRLNFPNLRALGMDVPSLACIAHLDQTMAAHNELLGGAGCRFLVIEDMDLNHDLNGLDEVRLCPWLVQGMDSSPCNIVGVYR
jgi:arylformamidase